MFWLHSDIFDISLKFPPNYLGVHRLTNHYTARTRQINVTMPWKRHVIGVYFFTDSVRRDSVLCDQHYCIDRFYARQFLPCACASRSPTRPIRQGKVCCAGRNMHMVRRDGQSMRRLVIRKVFVIFSAVYAYDLNRCLCCVCQGT